MRRALALSLGALGPLAFGPSCGPKDDVPVLRDDHCPVGGCTDASADVDAGPVVIPPEPLEEWDTADQGPLSGIFAVETTINAKVGIPVETRQLFRLRLVQHGKKIKQKTTLCAFKLPKVEGLATLIIPPALQTLMAQKHVEAEGDLLSSEALIGAAYLPPPSLLVVGAQLKDEVKDPLPNKEDLTTAVDEDQDGSPGVTLLASVVTCGEGKLEKLFVALRTGVKLKGKVLTPDRIEGKAEVDLDQSVLGFSDDCLTTAAQINIVVEPGSPFRAVRVGSAQDLDDNGNVSCPEIVVKGGALFGDFWGP
ncbi:MAG: hypothetical protein HYZ29_30220 [Myxococcales bacterium]|nr:hypothetical protein [Myxococcales bacterium]